MKWIYIIFLSFLTTQIKANISLPRFVSNGMVLQRGMPISIWGWADPNEKIQLSFNGKNYTTVTGLDKKWKIQLASQQAGGPYSLVIKGNNTVRVEDVLIGEVWLCAGQSNMEYELFKAGEKYPNEIASSTNDLIRHFQVKRNTAFTPLQNIESDKGWEKSNPSTVVNFSAIAYFFGRKLFDKYQVPIGLINCSYGGTPAEAWMSEAAVKPFPNYATRPSYLMDQKKIDSIAAKDKLFTDSWFDNTGKLDVGDAEKWQATSYDARGWETVDMPSFWQEKILPNVSAGVVWYKKDIFISKKYSNTEATLRMGNIVLRDITYVNGVKVGTTSNRYAPRKYSIAKNLLHEGLNTITVKVLTESGDGGFIKDKPYKLEIGDTVINLTGSWKYKLGTQVQPLVREGLIKLHAEPTSLYNAMLSPLIGYGIKGVIWYQGESNVGRSKEYYTLFPALINSWRAVWGQGNFPFLYVQLANINKPKTQPAESKLAELQDAQSMTLQLPNTGMAVANDIGEWNDVHPMNKMEAANRLYLAALKVAYHQNDIVYSGPTYESNKIVANKVIVQFKNIGSGLIAKQTGKLNYFAIADSTLKFVWADAVIDGDKVIVSSKEVAKPKYVRYAWADNPIGANLYNKEGLPASCFSTEKK